MKKNNLFARIMDKDWKIVEHARIFYIISAAIIVLGLIIGLILGPRLGIDFQGGYVIEAQFSNGTLTDENRMEKAQEIIDKLEAIEDDEGNKYGIVVTEDPSFQGTGDERTIRIRFKAVGTDDYMTTAMVDIEEKLQKAVESETSPFAVQIKSGGSTSAMISGELVLNAFLAIIAASICMLIYVIFRFELASGIFAVVALLHDVAVMFVAMLLFRIEFNSTFIAAIVTIIGYSINNTLVIFDRIRENQKDPRYALHTSTQLVNLSLKETFTRTMFTSLTTLVTISALAILGVPAIRIFAIPIIVGLIAGTYSSFCISTSLWANWKDKVNVFRGRPADKKVDSKSLKA